MSYDKSALIGLVEAKRAFAAIEPAMKDKLNDATEATAAVVAFQARNRVRRRFGILAAHIGYSMNRRSGYAKVGIGPRETVPLPGSGSLHLRTEQPTKMAHDVEFGHAGPHPAPPYPFLIPAAEGERENYLRRVQDAGREAEQVVAATGGGLL